MVEEGAKAADFFFDGDCFSIGAGGLGADVDDVSSVDDVLTGLVEGLDGVEGAVAGERVVVDVDDAHEEGAPWEGDGAGGGAQDHDVRER